MNTRITRPDRALLLDAQRNRQRARPQDDRQIRCLLRGEATRDLAVARDPRLDGRSAEDTAVQNDGQGLLQVGFRQFAEDPSALGIPGEADQPLIAAVVEPDPRVGQPLAGDIRIPGDQIGIQDPVRFAIPLEGDDHPVGQPGLIFRPQQILRRRRVLHDLEFEETGGAENIRNPVHARDLDEDPILALLGDHGFGDARLRIVDASPQHLESLPHRLVAHAVRGFAGEREHEFGLVRTRDLDHVPLGQEFLDLRRIRRSRGLDVHFPVGDE
ncbi:MAG: hypothetical protein JRG95_01355 [Deltaproteobacteria bacterium]|nr:hypothetical protein [Deltaproteobacteria bacterium]